ncbi:MAG: HAD-IA family hydrolase [Clostridia bacterium]|nr:HAD-IA family hydrolase [Clostridia bacterium]
MKYKAVIFDLDGTLVDTLDDLRASVNLALAQQGFPPRTREEIRAFVGNGVRKLMERSVPPGTPPDVTDACLAAFRAHYHTHACVRTRPYDGIPAVLEALHAAGMKTAVVTNKTEAASLEVVRHFFGDRIGLTIGQREDLPRKPAPDGVLLALETLGVPASQAVFVGDSEVDCATARNAGLPCIGAAWGFRGRAVLQAEGVQVIAEHPSELTALCLS